MSPWKYVFDEPLDIINHGIPYHLYKGKIVKAVHTPYVLKKYPERIMECDEAGELFVTKSIKAEQPVPFVKIEPEKVVEVIEEAKEPEIKIEEPVLALSEPKSPSVPKVVEKKPKKETAVKSVVEGIKNSSQLKSMFKEDLEDLCRKLGISEVGTKGALIKKISAALNIK
jgi:hypothetical protein